MPSETFYCQKIHQWLSRKIKQHQDNKFWLVPLYILLGFTEALDILLLPRYQSFQHLYGLNDKTGFYTASYSQHQALKTRLRYSTGAFVLIQITAIVLIVFLSHVTGLRFTPAVSGESYTVTVTNDELDSATDCTNNPTDCSLREAIAAANAVSGDNTISLPAGTYTLSVGGTTGTGEDQNATGDLDITKAPSVSYHNLTITGDSAATTIIVGEIDRVFHVKIGAVLILNNMTVQNGGNLGGGSYGGNIYVERGGLSISDSVVEHGSLSGSEIGGAGIACDFCTSFSIDRTLITGNTLNGNVGDTFQGSGVYINNIGSASITNSTITDNPLILTSTASSFNGGSVYIKNSSVTIAYSTIGDNTIEGSGQPSSGVQLNNANSTAIFKGTLLADNINNSNGRVDNCYGSGTFTSQGYNLSSTDSADCNFTQSTDQTSTDPLLDSNGLADHGGPTNTISLQTGSTALDAIPVSDCTNTSGTAVTVDQRSFTRPDGSGCDIGAFEADQTNPIITITNDNDETNILECNMDSWTDPGATVTDNADTIYDSTLTASPDSTADSAATGEYTITYSATDAENNTATATRAVTVRDTIDPTITLKGDSAVTLAVGEQYNDKGIDTVSDVCDTTLNIANVTTESLVNSNVPGEYNLNYEIIDAAGNIGNTTRLVTVKAKRIVSLSRNKNRLLLTYFDGTTAAIRPFNYQTNFLARLASDDQRLLVTNGRLVKVYLGSAFYDKAVVQKQKPNHYTIDAAQFYDDYDTVAVLTARASAAKLAVWRLTAKSKLTSSVKRNFSIIRSDNPRLDLTVKTKRFQTTIGNDDDSVTHWWELNKKGQLKLLR